MRIAIFTEVLSPYVCGISSYVEVLKNELESMSNKVLIVTSSLHTKKTFLKDGIVRCPAKKSYNKFGYECKDCTDKKAFDMITDFKPDIIHIHTDTKIGYMGIFIADKLNCPVVFTIHDFYLDRFAGDSSRLVWNIKTFFEKRHFIDMIDNSDVITSSCKRASNFVLKAGKKRKVITIPTSTDIARFDYRNISTQSTEKIREKLDIPSDTTIAVFSGNLSVEKNIEYILSAFAKYIKTSDNIQLLIVGDGTETEYLKSVCRKLKISSRVKFTGAVAHTIMPEIYSACDIYVCSSDDSLMSMSISEAIACGLPVLIKEDNEKYAYGMIKDGLNGFIYNDRMDFANKLKKLASLESGKKQILKSVVRKTLNDTSENNMARHTINAYHFAVKVHKKKK